MEVYVGRRKMDSKERKEEGDIRGKGCSLFTVRPHFQKNDWPTRDWLWTPPGASLITHSLIQSAHQYHSTVSGTNYHQLHPLHTYFLLTHSLTHSLTFFALQTHTLALIVCTAFYQIPPSFCFSFLTVQPLPPLAFLSFNQSPSSYSPSSLLLLLDDCPPFSVFVGLNNGKEKTKRKKIVSKKKELRLE